MADGSNNPLANVAQILEAEITKNVVSPLSKEVGLTLGTFGEIFRFYATDNLTKIFTKWARSRDIISAEIVQKVMPLLPLASMISEDELQERWAAVMESAATEGDFLPSFGQTLSQLTVEEVRYLDLLWKFVTQPVDYLSVHAFGREPLLHAKLVEVFDPNIQNYVSPAEFKIFARQMTDDQKAEYERLRRAVLVIEDLVRIGIIGQEQVAEPNPMVPEGYPPSVPFQSSQTILRTLYSFSQYGVSFMRAVTTRK